MAILTLDSVGLGATIQDAGRRGWLRYGVTTAGPMDWTAHETANRALGNPPGAAAIEIGLGGVALRTDAPLPLAFAGGAFVWTREGVRLPEAARIMLKPGETLRARAGSWGSFAILAVPGGIDVPSVMGSRATHVRSAMGGRDGRALVAGDGFGIAAADPLDDAAIAAPWLMRSAEPIGIVPGPQDDYFAPDAHATLLGADYVLTPQADRMAYKFDGAAIAHARDYNIVSDGVALGAIQIAGDGLPMVLMADRQPTGGYAKIAHVCRADIGRLAQMRPGDSCRFAVLSVDAARERLLDLRAEIAQIASRLVAMRSPPSAAALLSANLIDGVTDATSD